MIVSSLWVPDWSPKKERFHFVSYEWVLKGSLGFIIEPICGLQIGCHKVVGSTLYRMNGFWCGVYRRNGVTFTIKIQPKKNKAHTE